MIRLSVVNRLSLAGRLRRRFEAVAAQVARQEITRMEAGDRILREVIEPLGDSRGRGADGLRFEAELLRADYYVESEGATALEAASALEAAWAVHLGMPQDPYRAHKIMELAHGVFEALEEVHSRRTRFRVLGVLLRAAELAGQGRETAAAVISEVAPLVRQLSETREVPRGISETIALLGRLAEGTEKAHLRREIDREIFTLALRVGDCDRAMALLDLGDPWDAEAPERLALVLADQGRRDEAARCYWSRYLETFPDAARRVEMSLQRAAHVAPSMSGAVLDDCRRLNEAVLCSYPDRAWPCRNLAVAALRRHDEDAALVALSAALDRGYAGDDAVGPLASLLEGVGHHPRAAALLDGVGEGAAGDPLARLVRLVQEARKAVASAADDGVLGDLLTRLEDIAPPADAPARMLARHAAVRGHLLRALGDLPAALRRLQRAVAHCADDPAIHLDLAEACLDLGDRDQAEEWIAKASPLADPLRASGVRARIHEGRGELRAALDVMLCALDEGAQDEHQERVHEFVEIRREGYRAAGFGEPESSLTLSWIAEELGWARGRTRDRALDELRRSAARLAARLGDHSLEARLLAELAEQPGADRELLVRVAIALIRSGDPQRAMPFLLRLRERDTDDAEAIGWSGFVAFSTGRADEALPLLETACASSPTPDGEILLALVWLRIQGGEAEAALALLERLGEEACEGHRAAGERLRAAALERLECFAEAREAWGRSLDLRYDQSAEIAQGRLAVHLALATEEAETARRLLEIGAEGLRRAEEWEDRCLHALAVIHLGGDVDDDLRVAAGPAVEDEDPTLSVELGFATALRMALLRQRLERGDLGAAIGIAEDLPEPAAADLPGELRLYAALCEVERIEENTAAASLEALVGRLQELPQSPTVRLARELAQSLAGRGVDAEVSELEAPEGLRLAVAAVHLWRGIAPDRSRALVEDIARGSGPWRDEARRVEVLLDPDHAPPDVGIAVDEGGAHEGALITDHDLQAVLLRAAYLAGPSEGVEGLFDGGGSTRLCRRIKAARILEEAHREVRSDGDPVLLRRCLKRAEEHLPAESAARGRLVVARRHLATLLGDLSLAGFRAEIDELGEEPMTFDFLGAAEGLAERETQPSARQHLALVLHELALDLDAAGDAAAFHHFDRAHQAWEEFFAIEGAVEGLRESCGSTLEAMGDAVERVRRGAVGYHVRRAGELIESDAERASAHARLGLASPLTADLRDRVRSDLYESVTLDLDPSEGEKARDRLRRRLNTLFQVDRDNPLGLRMLLHLEARAIEQLFEQGGADPAALQGSVWGATPAIDALEGEEGGALAADGDTLGFMRDLGLWKLGASVIAFHVEGDLERSESLARLGMVLLEQSGHDASPGRPHLARVLGARAVAWAEFTGAVDEGAVKLVDEALEYDPDEINARMIRARHFVESESFDDAEAELERLYDEVVAADDQERKRQVVALITHTRSNRELARDEMLRRVVCDLFDHGEYDDALEMLGGSEAPEKLAPDLVAIRIRCHIANENFAIASRESAILRDRGVVEGFECEKETEARLQIAVSGAVRRCGPEVFGAWELLQAGQADRALTVISRLRARHPNEVLLTVLRARALAASGLDQDARVAAAEALNTVGEDTRSLCIEFLEEILPEGGSSER